MKLKSYSMGALFIGVLIFTMMSISDTGEENKLKQQLDQFIKKEPALQGAQIGISIRDAGSGGVLYEHLGDSRLRPASNLKLFTAAAALSTLGEKYTFATEIQTNGSIKKGKLKGNLYLKGKGDPTLLPSDFEQFAEDIRKRGIKSIDGDIIGDDTWYDDVRLSKDLVWSDEHFHYGAQVSALTASPDKDYDAGTIIVETIPGKDEGEKPKIHISPKTDYIKIINNAKTVAADEAEDLTIEREHGGNTITIEGEIPLGSNAVKEWMAVWEPTRYALDLFERALITNDISWSGQVKVGKTPKEAELLMTHQSMPLAELLIPFMKLSNNGHGEILVKEMGRVENGEGSWEKGLEEMGVELEKLGVDIDTLLLRDGSGISHVNLIPVNEITKLLYTIQEKDWFSSYLHALPVSGEQERMVGGTLQNRLADISVQAKTGTIDSVSSLSGYVETKSGENIIFSILLNNMLDEEDGTEIEDKIVRMIYEGL